MQWILRALERAGVPTDAIPALPPGTPVADVWAILGRSLAKTEAAFAQLLARGGALVVADLATSTARARKLLPEKVARRHAIVPLRDCDRTFVVATANPQDLDAEQAIEFATGRSVRFELAGPAAIASALDAVYAPERLVATALRAMAPMPEDGGVQVLDEGDPRALQADEAALAPVIELANRVLLDAVRLRASDVHLEPGPITGVVRLRVDGVMRQHLDVPMPVFPRLVSRIKVLARLNIADRLRPQDGRARIAAAGRTYDLRISTVPTRDAEKVVIRLLGTDGLRRLDDIQLPPSEITRVRAMLAHREGLVVVTGPTGSGKTTTLYGAIMEIATGDTNIMTVEDPVEYSIGGVTQIQVEPLRKVTFASALRAILRQDPDVIFIGEIRDRETAEIAVQAAMTGHLVLASLHANDAASVIPRLLDLGVDRPTLAAVLKGAISQRLVRHLCDECAVMAEGPETAHEATLARRFEVLPVRHARGCPACGDTGYRGRLPIIESLLVTPAVAELVAAAAALPAIEAAARDAGMRPLRDAGAERVALGETTPAELERVLGDHGEGQRAAAPSRGSARAPETPASALVPAAESFALGAAPAADPTPGRAPLIFRPVDRVPAVAAAATAFEAERSRVLVVDDDPLIRAITGALLAGMGYAVVEAEDGLEALSQLAASPDFALVVLDLNMPRLGGRETLGHLRRAPQTAHLPVIVLTSDAGEDTEMLLMDAGADDYITKPIESGRFSARVRATLRRAAALVAA